MRQVGPGDGCASANPHDYAGMTVRLIAVLEDALGHQPGIGRIVELPQRRLYVLNAPNRPQSHAVVNRYDEALSRLRI